MTLTLDLPAELETRLREQAKARGVVVEVVAIEVLLDGLHAQSTLNSLYEKSQRGSGELTAFSDVQEDIHEYTDEELKAMAAGAFEHPIERRAA